MGCIVEVKKIENAYMIKLPIPARIALDVKEKDYLNLEIDGDKVILQKGGAK